MIKNSRQYGFTKKQAALFEEALARFDPEACPDGMDPVIYRAQHDGMESQLQTLRREIKEYEALKDRKIETIALERLEDLPHGLIKARIARGMSHKDLADRLGVRPQQIQRWEFEDYENVSFSSLVEVANALEINVSECIRLTEKPKPAFAGLKQLGLDKNFIKARLVPIKEKWRLSSMDDIDILAAAASRLKEIYGVFVDAAGTVAHDGRLVAAGSDARFKIPSNADADKVRAYAVYARYLAAIVAEASKDLGIKEIPNDWQRLRSALCGNENPSFENLINGAWELGVPVLPLRDPVRFHGVCWRVLGRNVIILKQPVQHASRWAFDLLHELYHAGETPEAATLKSIELDATDVERRESEDEKEANNLAGNILLNGRAEELYARVMKRSSGNISWVKNSVENVATTKVIDVGALANYVAHRLKNDHFIDWWGAANNLQVDATNPFEIAREALFRHINLDRLSPEHRGFLEQALSDPLVA